jgi:bifunctional non-homologous end joining protein LigD
VGRAVGRVHWVKPALVAEVAFSEWTSDGRLRHPSFKGLREDKSPGEVTRETPLPVPSPVPEPAASAKPHGKSRTPAKGKGLKTPISQESAELAGVPLTHSDRVLYPASGLTKLDLARYYESIADWILPHLKDRPTTLVRCPEGLAKPCFYQKHTGGWAPETLRRVPIQEKTKIGEYLIADDLAGVIGFVQIGILEIHTWNSTMQALETPDRLVFDLDPDSSVDWKRVIAAAGEVRARLSDLGLESFVKTTGGTGLHVVVPIVPEVDWEGCEAFSAAVAAALAREQPGAYTDNMSKAKRKGRIFIDYLRNVRGATSVAAYSTRAKPAAPVSTPLAWGELDPKLTSDSFTVTTVRERLARLRTDPWKGYWTLRQRLTPRIRKAAGG